MYIEIDHNLVPGDIEDINKIQVLRGRKEVTKKTALGNETKFSLFKEYSLKNEHICDVLQKYEEYKNPECFEKNLEWVIGTDEEVWCDVDWGFFTAILACYNNHWTLRTTPDDWWNVVVQNVSQVVNEKADLPNVRDFLSVIKERFSLKLLFLHSLEPTLTGYLLSSQTRSEGL